MASRVLALCALAATGAVGAARARAAPDCQVPACHDKQDLFKSALAGVDVGKRQPASAPGRAEIGRAGWTILHTFAAYYPDAPTPQDEEMALAFLHSFARFYPCRVCAAGLESNLAEFPPQVSSRVDFCLYVCEEHNRVNDLLGKPQVRCDIKALDLAWRGAVQPE